MTWLFETNIFEDNVQKLTSILEKRNINYKSFTYRPFIDKVNELNSLIDTSSGEKVLLYGSLNLANYINNNLCWYPGTFCTLENYRCENYYPEVPYLLNKDYIILPSKDLKTKKKFISEIFNSPYIFIRPLDGFKSFTGKVISLGDWEYEVSQLLYNVEGLVLLSPAKNIYMEWRFIVSGNEIITGSSYSKQGKPFINKYIPADVITFAKKVITESKYFPDLIYCMDICSINNDYYVVELNSFSCAALYDCNLDLIVDKVTSLLER